MPKSTLDDLIPEEYRWPGADVVAEAPRPMYWVQYDLDSGRTPVYTVIAAMPEGQHIVATRCNLRWATLIVDGLRLVGDAAVDRSK